MDIVDLKAQIKSNQIKNMYIFTGSEVGVMDVYIEQIAKARKATVKRLDDVSQLVQKARTNSFVKIACVYVLRDCKDILSNDKLQALVTQNKALVDDVILLIYTQIDKRSKLYKSMHDIVVEFTPLQEPILIKHIKMVVDLTDANCKRLIQACESDYSRILLEIDKIKTYRDSCNADKTKPTMNDNLAFTHLIEDGTIYQPPYDAVFDFVDAVLKYKPKLAFHLLQESYDSGEATLVLLTNLYNSTKQLLQVQAYTGNDLAGATGLSGFQIKLASGRKNIYSNGDLVYLMYQIRDAEKGIKSGTVEESIAVANILINLWGY